MITLIEDNIELYYPEKKYYLKSLEYAKSLKTKTSEKLVFHCFWKVPREFGRKQKAVLVSIIVNHFNRDFELNLWSNVDLSNNILLKDIKQYIKFHIWDIQKEKKDTILESCEYMDSEVVHDDYCYLEGDIFRLLILNKYGGFYIDMDVLVLRDMSPLNHLEFLYQWGTSIVKDNNTAMNGAIMRFNKNSLISQEYLELIKVNKPEKNNTSWGTLLYSQLKNNTILVLPCIWFDSEWGFEDTKLDPFNKGRVQFFDGAFTWHWHNRWDDEIQEGSKFNVIEEVHNSMLEHALSK